MSDMWEERYSSPEFAYGKEPNDFVREMAPKIAEGGRVLCLAEGEGRNAVFLASRGHSVMAMDRSNAGLAKARMLAEERGVSIETVQGDLATFDLGASQWDAIVSVFAHCPPDVRARVHGAIAAALKPGGVLILEAYGPEQLNYKTGGPPSLDLLMSVDVLKEELAGLELDIAAQLVRELHEGRYHDGEGAVVRVLGHRPA